MKQNKKKNMVHSTAAPLKNNCSSDNQAKREQHNNNAISKQIKLKGPYFKEIYINMGSYSPW